MVSFIYNLVSKRGADWASSFCGGDKEFIYIIKK